MNIPDLTNASPGDVYQGPDGRLWRVDFVGKSMVALCADSPSHPWPHLVFPESSSWHEFKKVDG